MSKKSSMDKLMMMGNLLEEDIEEAVSKVEKPPIKEDVRPIKTYETPKRTYEPIYEIPKTEPIIQTPRQEIYNPIFDMSDRRLKVPNRNRRGERKDHKIISIYLMEEEYQRLEELSRKHGMSASVYIRTLLNNSY